MKICGIIMIVCSIILLVFPKNKLYDPTKVTTEEEQNKVVKGMRTSAIIFLVLGILFAFVF